MASRLGALVRAFPLPAGRRALSLSGPRRAARPAGRQWLWAVSRSLRSGSTDVLPPEDKEGLRFEVDAENFAHVTLSRPDKFNTFTDAFIARCTEVFTDIGRTPGLRGMFLKAEGRFFSAGADLAWMRKTAAYALGRAACARGARRPG